MKSDVIIIGGGASGLMAAYSAAKTLVEAGSDASVTVLEKMPRAARKIMITGKGRCNFTNVKDWNDFSRHIRTNPNFIKSAFFSLPSTAVVDFFEQYGMPTVVERGDRAFPASYHASDVVDALLLACARYGVKVVTDCSVTDVMKMDGGFKVNTADGLEHRCKALVLATGGLSYPTTGSSGEGHAWASSLGHTIKPCFPSLTALVPKGYKTGEIISRGKGHIDRSTPLSELGRSLVGLQLKNVSLSAVIDGKVVETVTGDVDFTDGGIEGPAGFQLSRRCVKALTNGSRVTLRLDLKPGVELDELTARVRSLWNDIDHDARSKGLKDKEKCRIMLGKLMPWDLIPAFMQMHPDIISSKRKAGVKDSSGRYSVGAVKTFVYLNEIAAYLEAWDFEIQGFVGYERCVVTAGGVSTDEIIPKTMASRLVDGLYLCGELTDTDCDTGGYNLQTAFCTGHLAGRSAAVGILSK